ncbi:MAG: XRE family transcriptional regulator [Gemmataceae bacterium]|nr:XRE family transcriptional regulator [Gemmataceae bacterium]
MDRSALSKLETGQGANPTVETLVRYAEAVGKRLAVSLTDKKNTPSSALPRLITGQPPREKSWAF